MHRQPPLSLALVLGCHACSSLPARPCPAKDDDYRVGPLLATAGVDLQFERSPSDPQLRIGDAKDFAWTGAIETDQRLLLLRADWIQAESSFVQGPGRAETDIGAVTLFAGPERFGGDAVLVTPIFGFGLGFVNFQPVDVPLDGESHLMVTVAAGVDIEILHHVQIQLVATHGTFGEPGVTAGEVDAISIGGGLRF